MVSLWLSRREPGRSTQIAGSRTDPALSSRLPAQLCNPRHGQAGTQQAGRPEALAPHSPGDSAAPASG